MGELDGLGVAVSVEVDGVAGVFVFDEVAGASDGDFVEDVEEVVGGEVFGVFVGDGLEVFAETFYAESGECGVVLNEVVEFVVEVPDGVVDGCGGHQDQFLGR